MIESMIELASVLGAHGFRVVYQRFSPSVRLVDMITREPIAFVPLEEARALATWLESESPLPARPVTYTLTYKPPRCCDRAPFHQGPCWPSPGTLVEFEGMWLEPTPAPSDPEPCESGDYAVETGDPR